MKSIKICILGLSVGMAAWFIYQALVSGLNPQTVILLLYVVSVIAAISFLPAQASIQAEQPSETLANTALEKTVLSVIHRMGKAKRHDLLPEVGLSRSSLGRLLDQMEDKGLIRQEGDRKASYYVLNTKADPNL